VLALKQAMRRDPRYEAIVTYLDNNQETKYNEAIRMLLRVESFENKVEEEMKASEPDPISVNTTAHCYSP